MSVFPFAAKTSPDATVIVRDDHFRQVLDASPNLAFIQDVYGHYVYVNEVWCDYFRRTTVDTLGKRTSDIHSPDIAAEIDRTNRLVIASGGPVQLEETLADSEGRPAYFAVSKFPFRDDRGESLIATLAVDITHYIQGQAALRAERDFSTAVLDAVGALVFTVDAGGIIERANLAVEHVLGHSPREMVGQSLWNALCWPADVATLQGMFEELRKTQQRIVRTLTCKTRDNSTRHLEFTCVPVASADGAISHVIVSAMDLTERHNAYRELADAKSAAEEANIAKTNFLACVSHELRTPMSALMGHLDLLDEPDLPSAQREHSLLSARRNADYLVELLNDFLDLSRIEAGKLTVVPAICSPLQIVAEAASLMRRRALEKGVKFDIEYVGPIPETITTDPIRLKQILVNLLGNAVKFTQAGSVRLVVRLMKNAHGDSALQFQVIDTGIGLTALQISHLFIPFAQADAAITKRFGGTGLGLAISRKLAEALGGGIDVDSIPGVSTTFSVTITTGDLQNVRLIVNPREAGLSVQPAMAQVCDECPRLHGRILLAEDGPDNAYLLTLVLKQAGASVEHAENGRIARRRAMDALRLENPYQLIFMDMQMPEMDGYTAVRLLRQQGYQLPIVALTAHAMPGDREKCLEAGCNDYLTKPVDTPKLIRTAASWMARATEAWSRNSTSAILPPSKPAPDAVKPARGRAAIVALAEKVMDAFEHGHWNQMTLCTQQLTEAAAAEGMMLASDLASEIHAHAKMARELPDTRQKIRELQEILRQIGG